MVRGLGLIVIGVFLVAQVTIASLDLTELACVLDASLTTVVVDRPVGRLPAQVARGLMLLGRYHFLGISSRANHPIADKLADAAESLSRSCVGA